ncbi:MarR family transcriptional regulator [Antrihabitans stalactiti]|uniref:MarR family transcriptional regulator n=1 Tax=Antrihabitans stalactiti TaxID=2584121 RepID=A0A848KIT5_9NOCA|nr:MarR family transcriptional regulator [Antrihabitans stalactiti]
MSTANSADREKLIQAVEMGGRMLSTAAMMFHTRLAELQGLNQSDGKALDLIVRYGPLTAGQLSERSGLAPASVTGLIGRLEKIGAARRVPHPGDGRKVFVEFNPQFATDNLHYFDELIRLNRELMEEFDDDQLRTIARYLTEVSERQMQATRSL